MVVGLSSSLIFHHPQSPSSLHLSLHETMSNRVPQRTREEEDEDRYWKNRDATQRSRRDTLPARPEQLTNRTRTRPRNPASTDQYADTRYDRRRSDVPSAAPLALRPALKPSSSQRSRGYGDGYTDLQPPSNSRRDRAGESSRLAGQTSTRSGGRKTERSLSDERRHRDLKTEENTRSNSRPRRKSYTFSDRDRDGSLVGEHGSEKPIHGSHNQSSRSPPRRQSSQKDYERRVSPSNTQWFVIGLMLKSHQQVMGGDEGDKSAIIVRRRKKSTGPGIGIEIGIGKVLWPIKGVSESEIGQGRAGDPGLDQNRPALLRKLRERPRRSARNFSISGSCCRRITGIYL